VKKQTAAANRAQRAKESDGAVSGLATSAAAPLLERPAGATETLASLRRGCQACRACPLYEHATQAVPGEGPQGAALMLVGEQPGDEEDRTGRPFVGPAGRLLDVLLEDVGIARERVFVTNAVKHFKFVERGKRRLHQKPRTTEVKACYPWLAQEIALVQPGVVVALGATAAGALLGSAFRLTAQRGELVATSNAVSPVNVVATYHPAALLRAPTPEAREQQRLLVKRDLAVAARAAASATSGRPRTARTAGAISRTSR